VQDTSLRKLLLGLNGGLGNQLFEYAAGLYFSERLSIPLELVRPHIKKNHKWGEFPRPFQLDAFSLDARIRTATTADRLILSPRRNVIYLRNKLSSICRAKVIEEPALYRFSPDLLDKENARTIYLVGFWQAAAYVEAAAERLRNSLRLRNAPQLRNLDYADAIRALACPISVHFRVGDYAVHAAVSWVLERSYYRAAIARIRSLLPNASFVVFSDDQAAAQEIMSGEPVSLWVEGNDTDYAYEDLWLMSCCKHHIIANSTFSWWGAWLNQSPEKIVLAPKYWLNAHDSYFPDLYPSDWTLIDNLA
jgi:hypothetical protein